MNEVVNIQPIYYSVFLKHYGTVGTSGP